MSLTPEWKKRIEGWKKELGRHLYEPISEVPLSVFFTLEKLTPAAAAKNTFKPIRSGTPWGRMWEYGWFKGSITIPKAAAGRRVVLKLDTGGESIITINGKAEGSSDWAHTELTLSKNAVAGQKFSLLAESYGGHGPWECHAGPTPLERETVPVPKGFQRITGITTFGIWNEELYQLKMDVETLYDLRNALDQNLLRVAEIDEALRNFTITVDFESGNEKLLKTAVLARQQLKPLLAAKNGPTMPTFFCFGHAHLDTAWLWPLAETERKAVRTFTNQLALAQEYPGYTFLASQPHHYRMIKNFYPEVYKRVKAAVRKGSIIPDGGMWIEADTNISGGEALIRQFLHGKRFFREEFGVENKLLWLPDVFGYSGNMPQIMQGCGIHYFATAKIFWNYNGGETFPHNTFRWEGIDGSRVLVHLCNDYNSFTNPGAMIGRWNERVQKDGIATRLVPFGHGDGGGGPTRDHLEYLKREGNLEGVPLLKHSAPVEYFKDQEKRGVPEIVYVGELYFQAHRGTYTSQAKTKKGNRKAEFALREAEFWGLAAAHLKGFRFNFRTLDEPWKNVLLNQFHDILPGSSINRVYKEAEAMHAAAILKAGEIAGTACSSLVKKNVNAVTVFNSLSFGRRVMVQLPASFTGAVAADGSALPVQSAGVKRIAIVDVPSCGWTTISRGPAVRQPTAVAATASKLENEFLRVRLNAAGEITSLIDKRSGMEQLAGAANRMAMYQDIPDEFDAWDIDSMYKKSPVPLTSKTSITVVGNGPAAAIVRVKRLLNNSSMTQDIILAAGSRRIEFNTTINWQERHKLLKVCFPCSVHANEAMHEIQMGHIKRPNHASRQFDADRFEVCNHKWTALAEENRGCAVLNDCKYGVNVEGNTINLTLLKSALAPDMTADRGTQTFTYAFYAWEGPFAPSGLVQHGYDLNVPALPVPGGAGERSLFTVSDPGVLIESAKPAEDGSGDIVLRIYESLRSATVCTIASSLPIKKAVLTDMLEKQTRAIAVKKNTIVLEFKPFEIKTVRLSLRTAEE